MVAGLHFAFFFLNREFEPVNLLLNLLRYFYVGRYSRDWAVLS